MQDVTGEERSLLYIPRLAAFALLIVAIVRTSAAGKNPERGGYLTLPLPPSFRRNRISEKCPSGGTGRCSHTLMAP
jgi:hypothetical protein